MMVHFRKRFAADVLAQVNNAVAQKVREKQNPFKGPDEPPPPGIDSHNGDSASEPPVNNGKLLVDATCAPADITYPAIANSRIKSLNNGMVTFNAKNRKQNRTEPVTISAVEFIRRFLLHSLPKGFVRIRHYGFLANRDHRKNLSAIRQMFAMAPPGQKEATSCEQLIRQLTGIDITAYPCCSKGKMRLVYEIPLYRARSPTRLSIYAR